MIGRCMVVVDTTMGMLRVLNPAASALWWLIAEGGQTRCEVVAAFADAFGLSHEEAGRDIDACIAEWRGYGWIAPGKGDRLVLEEQGQALAMAVADRLVSWPGDAPLPHHDVVWSQAYRLREAGFRITLGAACDAGFAEILPRVQAFLGGFPVADSDDGAEIRMVVTRERIVVRWPGGAVATTDGSAGVARLVLAIYQLAYPGETMVATLHAAALTGPAGTILMPGRSGNGKSTLSAHLAGQGWRYLADDSIGLAAMGPGQPPTVLAFPSAVGLKPATWPVLAHRFPRIAALQEVAYAGKRARFLDLTRMPLPDRADCVPRALVFPRYVAGHGGAMERLAPEAVMAGVAEAGLRTGETLDSGRIDDVLAFLEAVPAFAMTFGDLDWAQGALERL